MKNLLKVICLCCLAVVTTGCNKYIVSEVTSQNGDVYYGAYNRRDMIHSDVRIIKKGSDKVCDGTMYLNAPDRAFPSDRKKVNAKMVLGCNDGTLMDLNWTLHKITYANGTAQGVDQFNKQYVFRTISRSEYQQIADKNVKLRILSDKDKFNSQLKY